MPIFTRGSFGCRVFILAPSWMGIANFQRFCACCTVPEIARDAMVYNHREIFYFAAARSTQIHCSH
jgi:hypothetical protein